MRNITYVSLLLIFYIPSSWGVVPVDVVYRADSRNITEIEDTAGMWPRTGAIPDDDLAHHFEGESIENHTSNFISTSSSLQIAVDHAESMIRAGNDDENYDGDYPENFTYYIYMIRPDSNFYNVDESFIHARNTSTNAIRTSRLNYLINSYLGMNEWVARGGVPHQRIIARVGLTSEMYRQYGLAIFNASFLESRWELYRGYDASYNRDVGNNQVYDRIDVPSGIMRGIENGDDPLILLGLTCMSEYSGPSSRRQESSEGSCPAMKIKRVIYDTHLRRKILLLMEG